MTPFQNKQVEAAFSSQPEPFRSRLLELRDLAFDVAESPRPEGPQTAPLTESLKWGEPSYVPAKPRIGSPIRISRHDDQHVALYFNCNTLLVEQFRTRFGEELAYSGNRAVVLDVSAEFPRRILRECLLAAMTYHWQKRLVV